MPLMIVNKQPREIGFSYDIWITKSVKAKSKRSTLAPKKPEWEHVTNRKDTLRMAPLLLGDVTPRQLLSAAFKSIGSLDANLPTIIRSLDVRAHLWLKGSNDMSISKAAPLVSNETFDRWLTTCANNPSKEAGISFTMANPKIELRQQEQVHT